LIYLFLRRRRFRHDSHAAACPVSPRHAFLSFRHAHAPSFSLPFCLTDVKKIFSSLFSPPFSSFFLSSLSSFSFSLSSSSLPSPPSSSSQPPADSASATPAADATFDATLFIFILLCFFPLFTAAALDFRHAIEIFTLRREETPLSSTHRRRCQDR